MNTGTYMNNVHLYEMNDLWHEVLKLENRI